MNATPSARAAAAALAVLLLTSHAQGEPGAAMPAARALPAALDSLYPPISPAPVYLIKMHEMATPFSGIGSDAVEGDMANARANYDAFRQKYREVSGLIREWTSLFPPAPVDELRAALDAGAPDRIMAAYAGVGGVCDGCHKTYMPPAQHRYHWGDFGRVTVSDPSSAENLSFKRFMMLVESDMTGIGLDLQQGQIEEARRHAKSFRARFSSLKQTCEACHDTERRYYVDSTVFGMIDGIEAALAATPPRVQAMGEMLQKIGEESCFKCHLVHMAAAYAKP
jgi:cytochrome c556